MNRLATVSLLIAAGVVVHAFENFVPRPLPWAKPGLANVVTLVALDLFGARVAAAVALGRVFVSSLVTGSFGNLGFAFSLVGACFALAAMVVVDSRARPPLGLVGIGLCGAAAHAVGQLLVAWFALGQTAAVLFLAPSFGIVAAFSGLVVGLIAVLARYRLQKAGLVRAEHRP